MDDEKWNKCPRCGIHAFGQTHAFHFSPHTLLHIPTIGTFFDRHITS